MKTNSTGNDYLKVRVEPDCRKERIYWSGDRLIIEVSERAKENRANKRVFEIISFIFPQKRIELVKGSKRKNKIFKIYEKQVN